jgi:predicted nucleotide-binding protein (sugar kinase/HSP70/actin superfamily)
MEPFSNYFIEKELAKNKIAVSRFITVTYLLFEKLKKEKRLIKEAGKYLKYSIGADGTDSVSKSKMLAEKRYDGIIHVKPFGCTPEVNAMPMLQNISKNYKIPILYFSFDSQTSETGVKTRLEAFYDMLLMRKEKKI